MPVEHLSYSSINTYHLCPKSWHFRYIEKVPVPTSPALVFGSAFHDTVEDYIAARALGGDLDLIPRWYECWQEQLEQEIDWRDEKPETLCNDGVRMLSSDEIISVLNDIVPSTVQPIAQYGLLGKGWLGKVAVERKVILTVPGVPVPIIGCVDIITADGVPCDIKTSSRSWNMDRAQTEMQPVFYLASLTQMGLHSADFRFRHYVFVKTKEPKAQVINTKRFLGEIFWAFRLIHSTWQSINCGVFPPNPTTWKCSERWCEYWAMCRGRSLR